MTTPSSRTPHNVDQELIQGEVILRARRCRIALTEFPHLDAKRLKMEDEYFNETVTEVNAAYKQTVRFTASALIVDWEPQVS